MPRPMGWLWALYARLPSQAAKADRASLGEERAEAASGEIAIGG